MTGGKAVEAVTTGSGRTPGSSAAGARKRSHGSHHVEVGARQSTRRQSPPERQSQAVTTNVGARLDTILTGRERSRAETLHRASRDLENP